MRAPANTNAELGAGGNLLDRLETAVWIYDFDAGKIVWANASALFLWDAETPEDLAARDLASEMSASVSTRLKQHYEDFQTKPEREIHELWTLYPNNTPFRVRAILRRCALAHGRIGMMVEARAEDLQEPETIRSADALLHAQTIIALFDGDGRELYGNPSFRAAYGPGEHFFGQMFASPADLLDFEEKIKEAGEHEMTVRVRTVDGERWHYLHGVRCRDAVTGDGAFLINATDVTTSREQQIELERARDAAESAVKTKSQFLSTMSHEMRTPLNGIMGMGSMLAESDLSDDQKKMLGIVLESGQEMLELVESVLELVALDADNVDLVKNNFDLSLLVDSAVGAYRDLAEEKGIRVIASVSEQRGSSVHHDASRIGQVLRQLLSNAIKFTKRGFVSVRANTEANGTIRFEVADSGIGIATGQLEEIFSRFVQVDSTTTREFGGSGIGLSICKELVELWGGKIGADSEVGRGSVFWFTVPKAIPLSANNRPKEVRFKSGHLRVIPSSDED
jgi:signal transduction histidine kinase